MGSARRSDPPASPAVQEGDPRPVSPSVEPMLVCPNCGRQLSERKCKLFCPNPLCGYFLSCSDFY